MVIAGPPCCDARVAFTSNGSKMYLPRPLATVNREKPRKEQSQGKVSRRPYRGTGSSRTWLRADWSVRVGRVRMRVEG